MHLSIRKKTTETVDLVKRLTQIGAALSAERDRDRLLEMILIESKSISNADGGTLYFLNEADTLEYAIVRTDSLGLAYGGSTGKKAPMRPIHLFDPVTKEANLSTQVVFAVLNKMPVNIDDVYQSQGFDFRGTRTFDQNYNFRTQSVLTIPMISHRSEAIGCLQLINAKDPATGETIPFSEEMVQIVQSLASQAAVILDNKRLIEDQADLLESFIEMIAKAIDAKSPHTGNHCARVPLLTEMLADAACKAKDGRFQDFDLTEEDRYELHIAAWLHDCGKIVTPVHIMDKATKLETIFDRLDTVRARFETLKREARIRYLEALLHKKGDPKKLEIDYEAEMSRLNDDLEFLEEINKGGEFMEEEKLQRLERISRMEWELKGQLQPLLTENERYNLSTKRGTITTEERRIMNDHMVHTVNMLEGMPWPKHLRNVPEYACGHHEKMDGTGYPKGILAGTMSIPARMMAVADVFEALTASDRPYKPAKKLSEAMEIIRKFKQENHLDPDIVDLFVTSKVYLEYAKKFLAPELIDAVDEQHILDTKPAAMKL